MFDSRDWEQLLARSIVPKLAFALQELAINPAHQDLEPFQWVMAWQDVMPPGQLVSPGPGLMSQLRRWSGLGVCTVPLEQRASAGRLDRAIAGV